MDQKISLIMIFLSGIVMAGLSLVFLSPAFNKLPETVKGRQYGNTKIIYSSFAGILTTGALTLFETSSLRTGLIAITTPMLFLTLLLALHIRRVKKQQTLIRKNLPLLLDYLVLQVESGHTVQTAFRSASRLFLTGDPLHSALCELDESMQLGCHISQALENLKQRLDTYEADVPLTVISRAIKYGTPLSKILREQSKRIREYLILEGEQFANTVSVKILIPLLFFIFPSSFLVIFSPVIILFSVGLP